MKSMHRYYIKYFPKILVHISLEVSLLFQRRALKEKKTYMYVNFKLK